MAIAHVYGYVKDLVSDCLAGVVTGEVGGASSEPEPPPPSASGISTKNESLRTTTSESERKNWMKLMLRKSKMKSI